MTRKDSTPNASRRDPNARSVTFRLPLEMHTEISRIAQDERRSLNAVTVLLIEEALEARNARDRKEKAELAELRRLAKQAKAAERAAAAA
jgi:hypothetical protein